jgi:hypothetical protein
MRAEGLSTRSRKSFFDFAVLRTMDRPIHSARPLSMRHNAHRNKGQRCPGTVL